MLSILAVFCDSGFGLERSAISTDAAFLTLSSIWAALAALSDLGLLAALPLALVSVADEETGSVDSSRLTEELARGAAAALVFEAGRSNDALQRSSQDGCGARGPGGSECCWAVSCPLLNGLGWHFEMSA